MNEGKKSEIEIFTFNFLDGEKRINGTLMSIFYIRIGKGFMYKGLSALAFQSRSNRDRIWFNPVRTCARFCVGGFMRIESRSR